MSLGINTRITDTREQPSTLGRGKTLYVGGSGGDNYTSIQDAIDDTVDGDTVFVYNDSSPYWEEVVVDKSINLIGEDKNTTIITGYSYKGVVTLQAPNITLTEFTFMGNFVSCSAGVYILSAFNNVHRNIITDNYNGIILRYENAKGNQIHHNIIRECNDGDGILLIRTSHQKIYDNTISADYFGIELLSASNNSIYSNYILNNQGSIDGWNSSYNLIFNNYLTKNSYFCIRLYRSSIQNLIYRNLLTNNTRYGILLNSDDNFIYHNNFINNSKGHAIDEYNNTWDDGKYGNYWSDYEVKYPDAKPRLLKPWMWDTPYEIPGGDNKDMCPLVNQWPKSKPRTIQKDIASYSSYLLRFLEQFPILHRLLSLIRV